MCLNAANIVIPCQKQIFSPHFLWFKGIFSNILFCFPAVVAIAGPKKRPYRLFSLFPGQTSITTQDTATSPCMPFRFFISVFPAICKRALRPPDHTLLSARGRIPIRGRLPSKAKPAPFQTVTGESKKKPVQALLHAEAASFAFF
mgnify:CR=1 FL=1